MTPRIRCARGAAVVLSLLVPASAAAHGGMWRANRILIAPDDPQRIVLQSDLRGPIFTTDGGATWRWICAETYGRSSIAQAPVTMLLRPGGRMLVASYGRGVLISDGDPCTFEPPRAEAPSAARDIAAAGSVLLALGSVELDDGLQDVLFVSDDEGQSFRRLGAPLGADFTATSLQVAEHLSERLYVAGLDARGWAVARSDDHGTTWTRGATVAFRSQVGWSATVVGVGRDAPERLFVHQDESDWNLDQPSGDALYVSDDGGATLRPLFSNGLPLRGFASSPDGSTLLVAGTGGLYRATLTDALARGQAAFVQVADLPFYGLSWTEQGLYAGMEEFSIEGGVGYSLGISLDEGKTFTRRMSVCETEAYSCAPDTPGGMLCPEVFSDGRAAGGGFKEDFLLDRCQLPEDEAGAVLPRERGARHESDAPASRSGAATRESGCSVGGRAGSPLSAVLAGLLLGLGVGRRRRGDR